MRKAYHDTPIGQVHARHWGEPEAPPLLLLHWTPLSGRMFEPLAPHFLPHWHVIAPDLPGYGRSDPRPHPWTIADWANTIATLLPGPAAVLGGHLSAAVAIELALHHPVRALILDGIPFLTPELRTALATLPGRPETASPTLIHDRATGLLTEYGLDPTPDRLWPVMLEYLATDFVSSGPVLAGWDAHSRLPLVQCPLLLLGAEGDSLGASLDTARSHQPQAPWHRFTGPCPVHLPDRAADYASIIRRFLEQLP